MKLSRRALLTTAFGATQLALLDRFGLLREAKADVSSDAPTKFLTLYLRGGTRPQYFWWPLDVADADKYLPPPGGYEGEVAFGTPDRIATLGPGDGKYAPLQVTKLWDDADPSTVGNGNTPLGYGWSNFKLWEQTAVLHGIDQGTNAHTSAYIAAMSGVAGADYRAPAMQCVVANHFLTKFADSRPLPCVALSAEGIPQARDLPGRAGAILAPSIASLESMLSADPAKNWWWKGLDARTEAPLVGFDGKAIGGKLSATDLEAATMASVQRFRGRSTAATDAMLQQLYENYQGMSRVLASDVTTMLSKITPVEHVTPKPDYLKNITTSGVFGYNFGANFYQYALEDTLNMTLRFLKSDLATSIHASLGSGFGFDTHSGILGHTQGAVHQRGIFDAIARLLGEMKLSPAPGKPGKSLLDDTLVMIFSEFGRSWASGPGHAQTEGWLYPDDHHPITSVTYVGGGVAGNRMIGGFKMPAANGVDVDIDELGQAVSRVPRASDATATAFRIMGMEFDDFFLPGGFGEVVGLRRT
ncbi:Hypothetical protein A7982_03271 [Minicystis rosea]|nr:Hypothetical protein A7982_03271 [Minicystis rosea]